MTIAVDAALGGLAYNHGATGTSSSGAASWATGRHSLTTTNAVAAGGKIFVGAFLYATNYVPSGGSGGGLTWRIAINRQGANLGLAIIEADAPAGCPSGTRLDFLNSVPNSGGGGIWGESFTGMQAGAVAATNGSGPAASWTVGSLGLSGVGATLAFSGTLANGTGTYNTPGGSAVEIFDFGDAGGPVSCSVQYTLRAGSGTYSETGTARVGGTFNEQVGIAVLAAAAGGAATAFPFPSRTARNMLLRR